MFIRAVGYRQRPSGPATLPGWAHSRTEQRQGASAAVPCLARPCNFASAAIQKWAKSQTLQGCGKRRVWAGLGCSAGQQERSVLRSQRVPNFLACDVQGSRRISKTTKGLPGRPSPVLLQEQSPDCGRMPGLMVSWEMASRLVLVECSGIARPMCLVSVCACREGAWMAATWKRTLVRARRTCR